MKIQKKLKYKYLISKCVKEADNSRELSKTNQLVAYSN